MMPGSDFKACLETPYLTEDASAQNYVSEDLKLAGESLDLALEKIKVPGDLTDITLLAYRSMYSAARAMVHHAGYQVSNFRCLVSTLDELFVRTKKLDKNLLDQLLAAQRLVGNSDDHLKAAQALLARTKEIIA